MLDVDDIHISFGGTPAVCGVSFSLKPGDILAFLGPNGAGKTTTMRMICGYLTPDAGTITINELDVQSNPRAAKTHVGYLPENAPAYGEMSVEAFLSFSAGMHGITGSAKDSAIADVLKKCALEDVRHQFIDTLSKGYKHRVCFAQSILHDPELLVLDEPTDGLDPNQKFEIRKLIKELGKTKAIIISTHLLEEVSAVCNRAIIIKKGEIAFQGSVADLKAVTDGDDDDALGRVFRKLTA